MNAWLRLTHFLEQNSNDFPTHESLEEHIVASRTQLRWERQIIDEAETIGKGWRQETLWASRFNPRPEDMNLLEAAAPRDAPGPHGLEYERTWRTYIRNVFQRGRWYSWPSSPSIIFYVMENKVLAGREERAA